MWELKDLTLDSLVCKEVRNVQSYQLWLFRTIVALSIVSPLKHVTMWRPSWSVEILTKITLTYNLVICKRLLFIPGEVRLDQPSMKYGSQILCPLCHGSDTFSKEDGVYQTSKSFSASSLCGKWWPAAMESYCKPSIPNFVLHACDYCLEL